MTNLRTKVRTTHLLTVIASVLCEAISEIIVEIASPAKERQARDDGKSDYVRTIV